MKFKGVIFDLDGTLLNTLADIGHYINVILGRYGYPLFPVEKTDAIVGWGLKTALCKALPEGVGCDEAYLSKLTAELIAEYNSNPVIKTAPYPGIVELIKQLSEKGVMMSVFSNKSQPVALKVVDKIFGLGTFKTLLGSDVGFPRKPDPAGALEVIRRMGLEKGEILYVGDTILDHQTAANAGLYDVSVTWGFRSKKQLADAGAVNFVDTPAEILKLWE